MKEVAVYEAKARLSELLSDVEAGEQVVITRRGVPVARLVAADAGTVERERRARRVAEVFASLRQARQGVSLDLSLRRAIEDGRD
ncbi:MAG TPA: type II toxin-antitoxin system prevent-host-death family antitoxin [Burkholderiaceae bacterium]|nr:type II toxin-antitoxin system prevent-host-death family antitoxin [Burkholderiaceae bacterium]